MKIIYKYEQCILNKKTYCNNPVKKKKKQAVNF